MSDLVGIKYCLYGSFDAGEKRHPQEVMKDLGITYRKAVPQSIADMWQFFGCCIPDGVKLPPYLEIVDNWRQYCD
jgi:hypothetical protein